MGFTLVEHGTKGVNVGNPNLFDNPSGIFKVIYGLLLAPVAGFFVAFAIYYPLYKYAVKSNNSAGWVSRISYSLCVFIIFMAITMFFVALKVPPPKPFDSTTFGLFIGSCVGLFFGVEQLPHRPHRGTEPLAGGPCSSGSLLPISSGCLLEHGSSSNS